ncbi:hypothetical protein AMJ85_06900 [candidate division BRC1 bacterium SM23_51]|nr:MAG: hypothetical protein AMJ85_06900 [candidate division BRC1 bacterium SM23_51]
MSTTNGCRRWLWVACLLPLIVSVLFARHKVDSPNVSSRMDTIQSLVEQHSFGIDGSLNEYMVDVVKIDGRFYSDKPPLLSVLGAGVYLPLHAIASLSFERHAPWLYPILTVLLVGVPLSVGLWLLARCLVLAGLSPRDTTTITFLTAAGTLFLPYAVTFNNHVAAATAITAALYCVLRAESDPERARRWSAAAGSLAAGAFNFDLAPGGAVLLGFAAVVLWHRKRLGDLVAYGAGAAGPMALYFYLNWLVTGDLAPIYLHPEWYEYDGSVLRSYDALKQPYAATIPGQYFHMLFGYRGIFVYSPVLLFGLWEALRQTAKRERYKPHAIVALAATVVVVGAYAAQTPGMAGGSYGMRWLLPMTQFWTIWPTLARRSGRPPRRRSIGLSN